FRLAQDPRAQCQVPENLFLLGTMNTADRSVSLMDLAFRRRFAFVSYMPDSSKLLITNEWAREVEGISLADLLSSINSRLEAEGVDPERSIGHALLSLRSGSANLLADLRLRFEVDIVPLIMEYCALDRTGASRVLGNIVDRSGRPREL